MNQIELFQKKKRKLNGKIPAGYKLINNVLYPRVTSVIKIIDKPWLLKYYIDHGEKEAEFIKEEAADIGTETHKAIENYILSKGLAISDKLPKGFLQFFREEGIDLSMPFLCEKTLASDELKICGTPDFVGYSKHGIGIYDWKTSKNIYEDAGLQISFYNELIKEVDMDLILNKKWNPNFGCIVQFPKPTDDFNHIPYCRIPQIVLEKVLLPVAKSCKDIFDWQKNFRMNKERMKMEE